MHVAQPHELVGVEVDQGEEKKKDRQKTDGHAYEELC